MPILQDILLLLSSETARETLPGGGEGEVGERREGEEEGK